MKSLSGGPEEVKTGFLFSSVECSYPSVPALSHHDLEQN